MRTPIEQLRHLVYQSGQSKGALTRQDLRPYLDDLRADADGFKVALDYLKEHGALPEQDIELLILEASAARGTRQWINPVDASVMIWIPGGSFLAGNDTMGRQTLPGFSLARDPVTQKQFLAFVEASGHNYFEEREDRETICPPEEDTFPMTQVSWLDTQHYCAWASLCLPTSLQWEKGARGTDGRPFPWGHPFPSPELAKIGAPGKVPVGSFPNTRTPWGCRDMMGNVKEWAADKAACITLSVSDNQVRAPWLGYRYGAGNYMRRYPIQKGSLLVNDLNNETGFRLAF